VAIVATPKSNLGLQNRIPVVPVSEGFLTGPVAARAAQCQSAASSSSRGVVVAAGVAELEQRSSAASSSSGNPMRLPTAPLRADVPAVKAYQRGSFAKALSIVQSPELRGQAIADLRLDIHAASARNPRQAKLNTWEELARAAGFDKPFFLTRELLDVVMGALKGANYRSASEYMYLARQEHIVRYEGLSQSTSLYIRALARSVKRGLGSARHTAELPLHRFPELGAGGPWTPLGCITPKRMLSFGSHFLLREIELANVLTEHVSIKHTPDGKVVSVLLPVSKADFKAVGVTRELACCCDVVGDPDVCPVCIAEAQLVYWRHKRQTETVVGEPLFPTAAGTVPSKASVVGDIRAAARALGLDLYNLQGQWRHTGHACRATGAIFYALGGIEIQIIQLFARWGSDAFKLYVLAAPLHKAKVIARRAHAAQKLPDSAPIVPAETWTVVLPPVSAPDVFPGLDRLPVVGDDLVINLKAEGGPVVREEGRLHAVRPGSCDKARCGWNFGRSAGFRRTQLPDVGVLCTTCFVLARRVDPSANAVVLDSSSSDSALS
jgi:hypothetical protein